LEPKKRGGPSPIQDAIQAFLRESGIRSGTRDARTFRAWSRALEPGLRPRAQPVRFQGGTLTVEVDSATHLQELRSFTGEDVRRRANDALGGERIQRVAYKLRG